MKKNTIKFDAFNLDRFSRNATTVLGLGFALIACLEAGEKVAVRWWF